MTGITGALGTLINRGGIELARELIEWWCLILELRMVTELIGVPLIYIEVLGPVRRLSVRLQKRRLAQ